jgi:hypothetical protein
MRRGYGFESPPIGFSDTESVFREFREICRESFGVSFNVLEGLILAIQI